VRAYLILRRASSLVAPNIHPSRKTRHGAIATIAPRALYPWVHCVSPNGKHCKTKMTRDLAAESGMAQNSMTTMS
jgi:hypothetical protein